MPEQSLVSDQQARGRQCRWQPTLALAYVGLWFASAVSILLFSLAQKAMSILLVYLLLLVVGLILIRVTTGPDRRRDLRRVFISIYAYNVIVTILFYLALMARYGAPYLIGGTDDRFYDLGGQRIADTIAWFDYRSVPQVSPPSSYYGYLYTVALMHKLGDVLGGRHTLIPRLLNGFFGAWIPVLVYLTACRLSYSRKTARRAAYAAGFYPLMSFHAALILRDTIIGWLVLCIVYGVASIRSVDRGRLKYMLLVLVACVVLWEYRDASVFAIGLALFLAFIYSMILRIKPRGRAVGMLLALILLGALAGAMWPSFSRSGPGRQILRSREKYEAHAESRASADSLGLRLIKLPFPINYGARIAYALVEPLPVATSDLSRLWKSFGAIFWYGLLPFFLIGLPSQLRSWRKSGPAIASICLFVGVAITTLHDRHAVHYAPMFILFGVDAFERYASYRLRILALTVYAGAWLACIYYALKLAIS